MVSLYDNSEREMTIAQGCPWYEAQQSFGAPNVNWCESSHCSLINEPANTWSNLGFLLIGILIIYKINQIKERIINHFAWTVIVMGILSWVYHATNNYLTQFFDFFGMYLMTSFVVAFNYQRVRGKDPRDLYSGFWFMMMFNISLFLVFDITDMPVQNTAIVNILLMLALEIWAGFKEGSFKNYSMCWLAIVILGTAQGFSQADLKRIWCEPDNLFIHGHTIWHLLAAVGMLFIGVHIYRMLGRYKEKEAGA